jgi:hypothetical protein
VERTEPNEQHLELDRSCFDVLAAIEDARRLACEEGLPWLEIEAKASYRRWGDLRRKLPRRLRARR